MFRLLPIPCIKAFYLRSSVDPNRSERWQDQFTLFTGQWADLTLEVMLQKARDFGYDGVELACWGDHMDVREAASNDGYVREKKELLEQYGMQCFAISNHLAGQAVCDNIDARHEAILPPHVWGDGDPEGVRQRAAEEMIATAEAAKAMGFDRGQWIYWILNLASVVFFSPGVTRNRSMRDLATLRIAGIRFWMCFKRTMCGSHSKCIQRKLRLILLRLLGH